MKYSQQAWQGSAYAEGELNENVGQEQSLKW